MKLRNKKTGEIFYPDDWEAFEPTEPLIKDEEVRKALREWMKIGKLEKVIYVKKYDCLCYEKFTEDFPDDNLMISFASHCDLEQLKDGQYYSLNELCGEEEND